MKKVNGARTAIVIVAVSPGRAPITIPAINPSSAALMLAKFAMAARP